MKWNIKDWHANYYYNITAILQQQARVPISSVPILNFFNWFVGLKYTAAVKHFLPDCTKNMRKRTPKKFIEFCDFVLRNFDHRNFAFVSAALAGRKKLQWRFWEQVSALLGKMERLAQRNKINKFFRGSSQQSSGNPATDFFTVASPLPAAN